LAETEGAERYSTVMLQTINKKAVDNGEEPVYNTARSVPAEVRWGKLLLNHMPAG